MRYSFLFRRENMSFQRQSEAVGTPSRVQETAWRRPATEKARRPNVLPRCRGTISWRQLADLWRWRLETSDVRVQGKGKIVGGGTLTKMETRNLTTAIHGATATPFCRQSLLPPPC